MRILLTAQQANRLADNRLMPVSATSARPFVNPFSRTPTAAAPARVAAPRVPATPRLAIGIDAQTADWSITNAKGFGRISNIVYESRDGAINLLTRMGATDVKFFDRGGSQGLIASAGDRIIVAFRGTEPDSIGDWMRDIAVGQRDRSGGEVHRGFADALDEIWPAMMTEVKRLNAERARPVFLTGHSMGGAMATMAALDLADSGLKPRAVYTYGSPVVGDRDFAERYNDAVGDTTYRVVNQTDDVPRLQAPGYKHVGEERYLNASGDAQTGTNFFSKFWDRLNRRIDEPVGAGITDHRMNTYESQLSNLR